LLDNARVNTRNKTQIGSMKP